MPPNNTYINFERFSQVLEEIAAAEEGLRDLERNQQSCREDVAALLSIYEEKEGWYKEENQSISTDLSYIRRELQHTQAQRKKSQEETRFTTQAANVLKRKFGRLENRYEVLAEQVASEVRWVEELVKSMSSERAGLSSSSMPWAQPRERRSAPSAYSFLSSLHVLPWQRSAIITLLPSQKTPPNPGTSRLRRQRNKQGLGLNTFPMKDSFLFFYTFIYNFSFYVVWPSQSTQIFTQQAV